MNCKIEQEKKKCDLYSSSLKGLKYTYIGLILELKMIGLYE